MANLNKVLLLGNVTRDPEVRYTPKGSAVCDLGVAVIGLTPLTAAKSAKKSRSSTSRFGDEQQKLPASI